MEASCVWCVVVVDFVDVVCGGELGDASQQGVWIDKFLDGCSLVNWRSLSG